MAIEEQPREDLMREATAYARRIQWLDAITQKLYFFGLRVDGGWSIYFGEDPVYQFNSRNELRRAFVSGRKYAAVAGKLCRLEREASGGRVELRQTHDIAAEQLLLKSCLELLHSLLEDLKQNRLMIHNCYPLDDKSVAVVMLEKLVGLGSVLQIAKVANVRG